MPSRNKLDIPANLEQASSFLLPINWRLLPTAEFDQLLAGEKRLSVDRELKLYLTSRCVSGVARLFGVDLSPIPQFPPLDPACLPLIDDIREFLRRQQLPCLVVQLPLRHELIGQLKRAQGTGIPEQTRQFVNRIGARVMDGSEAFQGLDEAGIRDCWLPYDGHWGQSGSDRFARYMVEVIRDWQQSRAGGEKRLNSQ
jgi:hypothetical protein